MDVAAGFVKWFLVIPISCGIVVGVIGALFGYALLGLAIGFLLSYVLYFTSSFRRFLKGE